MGRTSWLSPPPPVPSADVSIGDELVIEVTIHAGVIWLADAQEIRRQIASRYLAGIDKDVGGEQAKREDTCGEKTTTAENDSSCCSQSSLENISQSDRAWRRLWIPMRSWWNDVIFIFNQK